MHGIHIFPSGSSCKGWKSIRLILITVALQGPSDNYVGKAMRHCYMVQQELSFQLLRSWWVSCSWKCSCSHGLATVITVMCSITKALTYSIGQTVTQQLCAPLCNILVISICRSTMSDRAHCLCSNEVLFMKHWIVRINPSAFVWRGHQLALTTWVTRAPELHGLIVGCCKHHALQNSLQYYVWYNCWAGTCHCFWTTRESYSSGDWVMQNYSWMP